MNATVPMDSERQYEKIMVKMNFDIDICGGTFKWSEKVTNCHEVILRIQNLRCSVIRVTQESKANLSL